MHSRHLALLLALGSSLLGLAAQAATNGEYMALRANFAVTTPLSSDRQTGNLVAYANQVIELTGTVSDMTTDAHTTYFLLGLANKQSVQIALYGKDADIANGNTLRVLACVPSHKTTLEALGVTPAPAPPQLATAPSSSAPPPAAAITVKQATPAPALAADPAPTAVADAPPAPAKPVAKPNNAKAQAVKPKTANSSPKNIQFYIAQIRGFNRNVTLALAQKIATLVVTKSRQYGLDPRLVLALIAQESHFNPQARSRVGAVGLGQLMPGTAALLGIANPRDIAQNIEGTVRYLSQLARRFGGDITRAVAAYNAGPGNVLRYGGVPPFRETQNYVHVIFKHFSNLSAMQSN